MAYWTLAGIFLNFKSTYRNSTNKWLLADLPLFDELRDNADDQLFDNLRRNSQHTLHNLLPPESLASQNYNLRSRAHNRQLPENFNHLDDSNFIIRMLYKNMY